MPARKSKINTNPFRIMHPEFAYLIGYALADGNLNSQKNCLSFKSVDKDLLNLISNYFSVGFEDFKYKPYTCKQSSTYPNAKQSYSLNISSKEFCEIFEKAGIIPNKSYSCPFPMIDEKYFYHFLRGVFDGDGNLYSGKDGSIRITIAGNKETIIGIKTFFDNNGITSFPYYLEKDRVKILTINGCEAIKVLELMYDNSENLRLERKYLYYLKYKENRNIKCTLCEKDMVKKGTLKMCSDCKIITRRLKNRRNDHYIRKGIKLPLKDLAKGCELNLNLASIETLSYGTLQLDYMVEGVVKE